MGDAPPDAEDEDVMSQFPAPAPVDPRFPNQNQTYYCYSMFVDYHRCKQLLGEEYEACGVFEKNYKSICPNMWIEKWNQQIEDGTFAARLPNDKIKGTGRKADEC